jgi:GNAT superfamily N-acetyltransferase
MPPLDRADVDVQVNVPGMAAEYLTGLNRCFPDWGGADTYRWAFERTVGAAPPDLMAVRQNEGLVAGSAISYRQVALARGGRLDVGIMTGSWTLPEARGKGYFTRMIEESVGVASQRRAALLLAFVTEDNPSARRLTAAGSALFPTFYLFSTPETPKPESSLESRVLPDVDKILGGIVSIREAEQASFTRFVYPTTDAWLSQFVERPGNIEVLALHGGAWCILERSRTSDRVQLIVVDRASGVTLGACLRGLLRQAGERSRQLFLFATQPAVREEGRRLGLAFKPGFLTALVANETPLREALRIDSSRPLHGSAQLADPNSPWFLGNWDLQSGDRA